MHRPIPSLASGAAVWLWSILLWGWAFLPSAGVNLPEGPLSALQSEEFRVRETGQAELLAWSRQRPEEAMDELYRTTRNHGDPEVRERCLAVLRELVNDEYAKEGEGFLGIRMQDEKALVPGEPEPRSVIRVIQVVQDSAAQKAGVQLNDLITGIDEKVWRQEPALMPFMNHIRQLKPGHRVVLRVMRNEKPLDLPVVLGRRPLAADNLFLGQRQEDLDAAERSAKDAYFRRWLERRKAQD